jgi:4-hydroxybenzoate polyprenyltransferase
MAGMGLSLFLSPLFAGWMALYLLMSLSYSFWIKKTLIVDTFVLTALYMHRILAGFIIAGTTPGFWPILFAAFFFLGLAMLARYGELRGTWLSGSKRATRAIAYRRSDLDILASVGLASGYLSTLILALYVLTPQAHMLFRSPEALWNLCPLLIYWITRVWIYGRRGRIPDDPALFVLEDTASGYIALACAATILVAMFVQLPLYTLV